MLKTDLRGLAQAEGQEKDIGFGRVCYPGSTAQQALPDQEVQGAIHVPHIVPAKREAAA